MSWSPAPDRCGPSPLPPALHGDGTTLCGLRPLKGGGRPHGERLRINPRGKAPGEAPATRITCGRPAAGPNARKPVCCLRLWAWLCLEGRPPTDPAPHRAHGHPPLTDELQTEDIPASILSRTDVTAKHGRTLPPSAEMSREQLCGPRWRQGPSAPAAVTEPRSSGSALVPDAHAGRG